MDRVPLEQKTNRDHVLKHNLGRYCPKTFEAAKEKKWKVMLLGVKYRTYGLSHQRSATEL